MSEHAAAPSLTVTAPPEMAYPSADDFAAELTGLPADGRLVIDLCEVDIMDSSGLRALLLEHRRRTAAGGTISLRNPTPLVNRLLAMTGVDRVLTVDR